MLLGLVGCVRASDIQLVPRLAVLLVETFVKVCLIKRIQIDGLEEGLDNRWRLNYNFRVTFLVVVQLALFELNHTFELLDEGKNGLLLARALLHTINWGQLQFELPPLQRYLILGPPTLDGALYFFSRFYWRWSVSNFDLVQFIDQIDVPFALSKLKYSDE